MDEIPTYMVWIPTPHAMTHHRFANTTQALLYISNWKKLESMKNMWVRFDFSLASTILVFFKSKHKTCVVRANLLLSMMKSGMKDHQKID